jgi:Ca-activated chloride channel family protein
MTASGGTEIYQGLRAGLNQVAPAAGEARLSHLILLTDGHTYGDAEHCLSLAQEAAARGIGITAFGLGADWNDSFLDALVAPSSGQSHFIEKPDDIFTSLEGRLDGLGALYARNLCLRRSWPGQFVLHSAYKLTPFLQPLALDSNPLVLGDLEGRAPLAVLLEFRLAPQTNSTRFRIPLEAAYTLIDGSAGSVGLTAELIVLNRERYEAKAPPARVIESAWRVNLYRLQERAWHEAQMGQTEIAAALLRRLSSRYLETGELRLADQAQREAQELAQHGAISAEGRKLLKYGTRSLARDNKP